MIDNFNRYCPLRGKRCDVRCAWLMETNHESGATTWSCAVAEIAEAASHGKAWRVCFMEPADGKVKSMEVE